MEIGINNVFGRLIRIENALYEKYRSRTDS